MNEFCALRTKTYTFKLDNNHEVKTAKRTKKCVIENQLTFKDYSNTLFNKVPMIKSQFGFRSRNHEIYTERINKIKEYRMIMELIHILMVILIIIIKKLIVKVN